MAEGSASNCRNGWTVDDASARPSNLATGTLDVFSYFPEMHPDETLSSAVARFARHTGLTDRQSGRALSGPDATMPSLAFPAGLRTFARRIGDRDPSSLIRDHTAFNYYTAFESTGRAAALERSLLNDPKPRHPPNSAVMAPSTLFPPLGRLRFCDECMSRAESRHGERYWRRIHQIPLVMLCPEHGCVLRETEPLALSDRRYLHPATTSNSSPEQRRLIERPTADQRDKLLRVALDCEILLGGDYPTGFSRQLARSGLRNHILHTNHSFGDGRCDWRGVKQHAARELAWMRPVWPQLFDDAGLPGPWLRRTVHGDNGRPRADLVQLAAYAVLSLERREPTFGSGPWTCRNPLADHRGRRVVRDIERERKNRVTIGRFACNCGFVYTRQATDDGRLSDPAFSRFGPLLPPFIDGARRVRMGISQAAATLALSPVTLRNALAAEGVADPWPRRMVDRRDASGRFLRGLPEPTTITGGHG